MVHQFYGRKIYYIFLFILYGSLQSTNIASIVGSAQIFDNVFVKLFGGTCGFGITPKSGLFCVNTISNVNSPFGDNFMLTTLGYLVFFFNKFVMLMIIPMTLMDLNDNMFLQLVSLVYNGVFLITLLCLAVFNNDISASRVPVIGSDLTDVFGQVLYNFSIFIN